ncbi:MAG: hypothetical protein JO270_18055, partial [Acidobacteriaceae bacterium]|nr:hypothetical protein [Acidobacteriaceae bacterium]
MRASVCARLAVVLAAISVSAAAATGPQRELTGIPLIRNYPIDWTGGSGETLLRDHRGLLYLGTSGQEIQQYDGSTWRGIWTTMGAVFALAMDDQGKIWAAGNGDFGYLEPDSTGALKYVSLKERVPPEHRTVGNVFQIAFTPQGTFFLSREQLFR